MEGNVLGYRSGENPIAKINATTSRQFQLIIQYN